MDECVEGRKSKVGGEKIVRGVCLYPGFSLNECTGIF